MEEEFRPVNGYDGLYEVGSRGSVVSVRRGRLTLSPSKSKSGYLRVNLCRDGAVKTCAVHRLVAGAFITNADRKPQVNHKDGKHANNSVDNLEWVNQSENMAHAFVALGLHKAFKYSRAKLSEIDVIEIRSLYSFGAEKRDIAMAYGVSEAAIHKVVNNLRWIN